MRERVYVVNGLDTAEDFRARRALNGLGAIVLNAASFSEIPQEFRDMELVMVFVTDSAELPSKHIRVLPSAQKALAGERKLAIPEDLRELAKCRDMPVVAIKAAACAEAKLPRLRTALENMHYRDFSSGRWTKPKEKKSSSGRQRSHEKKVERARSRQQEYALE